MQRKQTCPHSDHLARYILVAQMGPLPPISVDILGNFVRPDARMHRHRCVAELAAVFTESDSLVKVCVDPMLKGNLTTR